MTYTLKEFINEYMDASNIAWVNDEEETDVEVLHKTLTNCTYCPLYHKCQRSDQQCYDFLREELYDGYRI